MPEAAKFTSFGDAISASKLSKPEPVDRGQPTVFMPGEHVDEFEVEYSADEIKKAGEIAWILQKIAIRVDFSKSKDASLDCNNLPY